MATATCNHSTIIAQELDLVHSNLLIYLSNALQTLQFCAPLHVARFAKSIRIGRKEKIRKMFYSFYYLFQFDLFINSTDLFGRRGMGVDKGQTTTSWLRKFIFLSIDGLSECVCAIKTHLQFNMLLSNILPSALSPIRVAATPSKRVQFRMKRQRRMKSSASAGNVLLMEELLGERGGQSEKEISLIQFVDTFNFHQLKWDVRSCTFKQLPAIFFPLRFFLSETSSQYGARFIWDLGRIRRTQKKGSVFVDSHLRCCNPNGKYQLKTERTIISNRPLFTSAPVSNEFYFRNYLPLECSDHEMHFSISSIVSNKFASRPNSIFIHHPKWFSLTEFINIPSASLPLQC